MLYGAFSLACLFALLLLLSQLFNYPLGVKVWQWHVLHNVCTRSSAQHKNKTFIF